ncbi:hypothetical protein BGZ47_002985 [Haplosporangium gracile]|nr:hypothetical protein BGZ47_002985 [Haplosporangium gracile]
MRVSRDRFKEFVAHVWHTVDLTKDKRFADLSPQVLDKYGHYIIRRNNATLTELVFRGPTPQPDTLVELRNRNENYFEPSILNSCFISSLDSTMVKSHLTSASLNRVLICHVSSCEICMPDPGFAWTPCLLHHFPCLEEWHLAAFDRSSNWSIDDYFRDKLRGSCPRLKTFRFDWMSNTDNLSDLLYRCIRRPESLTFTVNNMSEKMAFSLIIHNNTLTSITVIDKCLELAGMKWGFESAQAIDACLKLLSPFKQNPSSKCINSSWRQIFNHLRQFEMLTTVWHGIKVYYLAVATA